MNRMILTAVAALALSSASAMAQNAAPAASTPAARPATPVTTTAPATARPLPNTGSATVGSFQITPQVQAALQEKVRSKQAECAAKGNLYQWHAPHMPGELAKNGKAYTTMSLGRCGVKTGSQMIKEGLVSPIAGATRPN